MGNIFSNCFTQKQKDSDRKREEEENKHHERNNASADRISDLPDDILHLILSFLPFKSVGQASVLSRRWSHLWSSYPIIDFHDIFTGNEAIHHQTKARIINTVLARRDENYNIKVSRVGRDRNDSCLPRVEEIVLNISSFSENRPSLPQCQLTCLSLRSIESETSSCQNSKAWLGFPSSYVVGCYLRSLHTLSLNHVDFLDSDLVVDLFSGSSFHSLEKLNIERCGGMSDLKISCPNLKIVYVSIMDLNSLDISGMRLEKLKVVDPFKTCIYGSWVNIFAPNLQSFGWASSAFTGKCSIQSFPTLKRSGISYCWDAGRHHITTRKMHNNGIALLFASSQVEEFEISCNSLQILSEIYFKLGGLPFSFMKLKKLKIGTVKGKRIPGVACLLKSSPVVDKLKISFRSIEGNDKWKNTLLDDANCTEEQYWEAQAQDLSPFLSHLQVADIDVGEMVPKNAFNFAKFLLKYARGLQKLILHFRRSESCLPPDLMNDTIALLEGFPRASAEVKYSTLCH